ncbi:MAG: hypothetical protein ABIT10_05150 [Alteraurantiacibacter sp.]
MNQTFSFYDARANESAAEAAIAKLDMVRERALRSEKTWRTLADQALRLQEERAKAEAERATRKQAEADLALATSVVQASDESMMLSSAASAALGDDYTTVMAGEAVTG